jgi:hypothetical protein
MSRRRKPVRRTAVSSRTVITVSVPGGDGGALARRVYEAATIIAEGAKDDAAQYPSTTIPESIHVGQGSETTATIYADAPAARTIELGLRHPLFGNRDFWYPMRRQRFLENGAVNTIDAAAAAFAMVIDDWAIKDGFTK